MFPGIVQEFCQHAARGVYFICVCVCFLFAGTTSSLHNTNCKRQKVAYFSTQISLEALIRFEATAFFAHKILKLTLSVSVPSHVVTSSVVMVQVTGVYQFSIL